MWVTTFATLSSTFVRLVCILNISLLVENALTDVADGAKVLICAATPTALPSICLASCKHIGTHLPYDFMFFSCWYQLLHFQFGCQELYSTVNLPQFYSGSSNEQTEIPHLSRIYLLIRRFAEAIKVAPSLAHVLCRLIGLHRNR
jgi:hypothetical protein